MVSPELNILERCLTRKVPETGLTRLDNSKQVFDVKGARTWFVDKTTFQKGV